MITVVRRFPLRGPMQALACWLRQAFAPGPARRDAWPPRHPAEMAIWLQDAELRRHSFGQGRAIVEPGVRGLAEPCSRRPTSR